MDRNTEIKIKYFLEQLLPPLIRDSQLFSNILMKAAFGSQADRVISFKAKYPHITATEYNKLYQDIAPNYSKDTDLSAQVSRSILSLVKGRSVLDVGCGNGWLIDRIHRSTKLDLLTGLDVYKEVAYKKHANTTSYAIGSLDHLPFRPNSFDSVICSHVLEHVIDLEAGIAELRRVARQQLIIVVPKERPYKHTPNLHLRYFPYPQTLVTALKPHRSHWCQEIAGDIVYTEQIS